jgi:oligopeptide transport system substrate-binding protein
MFASRFRFIKTVAVAAAVAALAMPALAPLSAQAQAKKVIQYAASGEPATIDPQVASYVDQVNYDNALFRGLLRYDHNGNPSPSIAKDVPTVDNGGISKDGMTYTYHLRTDWKWSDGNGVVKAQDFVYAFQRLVNPKMAAGYGSFLDGLLLNADTINNSDPAKVDQTLLNTLGVKAVDDSTVQFTLVHPAGYFNQIACLWFGYAVRKDNVERAGDPATGAWTDPANGPVVGSGPFILSKWDHNKEIVFIKNTNFSGDQAKLDEVDWPIIQDATLQLAGFKAGQLDVAGFPAVEYKNIKADPKLGTDWKSGAGGLLVYPNTCSFYYGMDNTKPPFDNKDVRLAFNYAFDRDSYVHIISQDLATKWLSFLPPAIADSDPKLGSAYDYNPDKAKAALAKAGYPNGQGFPTVSFHYTAGATGQRRADWLQAQFKKVLNITLNEDPMDAAVFQAQTSDAKNKIDGMIYLGWCADYLHPSDWFLPVFGSNPPTGNATDVTGFHDANFEKLAAQADAAATPADADKLYQQAQQALVDDVPVIFADIGLNFLLVSPKLTVLPTSGLDSGVPGGYYWEEVDIAS